jgi:superfamily I DNA/RNA helicase
LDPPGSTEDFAGPPLLDEDYLILSTIHSAKGLEWDAVYVIHGLVLPSEPRPQEQEYSPVLAFDRRRLPATAAGRFHRLALAPGRAVAV